MRLASWVSIAGIVFGVILILATLAFASPAKDIVSAGGYSFVPRDLGAAYIGTALVCTGMVTLTIGEIFKKP